MKTSFAALALVAAAASVQAADLPTCAPATNLLWVNRPDSKACATASGYVPSTYATPTQEIFDKFCPVESCRNMIAAILAVRPAAGDCVYKPSSLGVNIKFYEAYVDVFAKACNVAPGTTAPPATTTPAPVPTTTAPVPTTTAPVPTTTAPVPTTTSPTPTVTTKTPCPLPQPTTARPQC